MVGGNGGNQFRQYAEQNSKNQIGYNAGQIAGNQNRYNAVKTVDNHVGQNAVHNLGIQIVGNQNGLIVVLGIANQNANQIRNGNVVAARAEGDIDEIKEVNANYFLMANLQQASTSGTQTDKAPVYDSDRSVVVIQICLWCVNSGCSKHMTGNLKLLINFVWKFMRTVLFGNDYVAIILGYGDLQWGYILIARIYYVEGLGHNLFLVEQFCDSDLDVAFKRNTCFNNLHEMASTSPICLMARATSTKSWLWHQRLSHLNFDTINNLAKNDLVTGLPKFKYTKEHLCPFCEQRKSKTSPHKPKPVPNSKQSLHLLHFNAFTSRHFSDIELCDVIGTIVSISDAIPFNTFGVDKIRRTIILEDDVVDDMPLLSNAKSFKFNTTNTIPFNINETPKSTNGSSKGNGSNGDGEGNSKAIKSDGGDSGSGKHTIIDLDDYDE
ncbi:retrovirus-related pol polyprotein from transposon TNT 1-94 [Tanacetum coccineum]|uniref:Retrovirus-related pol polyprotein from transposon TNT 1-94 n=1 Tax=Tanacetum coccineum TaxID=301880 RepID=A0ABQ5H8C9_9ASTR